MIGKTKGKSLELLLHGDPNQCCIPGSVAETSGIIKDVMDAEVMISTTSSFNSLIWPVMRADSSWRMTVDCNKLNQVLVLIVASIPNVVSLLEQINTSFNNYYVTIDKKKRKTFFPPNLLVKITRNSLLLASEARNTPSLSYFKRGNQLSSPMS